MGTRQCMDTPKPPGTPEGVRRWRKSNFAEAGQKVVHPGLINDVAKLDQYRKYGKTTAHSDHVENVFGHGPQTQYQDYSNDKAEAYYASKKMEPLGKSYMRGHKLPAEANDPDFAFGIPTGCSESSKNLLYPTVNEDESVHSAMYTKSHGSYAPGEQRDREYKWNNATIDKGNHRFGKKEKNPLTNGVSLSMNPESDRGVPKTRITAKQVEDVKNTKDQLGRSRNLGLGPRDAETVDHIFGVKGTIDSWDAQACIQGDYTPQEQAPDMDLGTSATPGWRNTTTDTRAFGCPTVRTDVKNPAAKSVSDNQNYGDDVNAHYLLYPPQYATAGVEDEDFAAKRTPEDIRGIFTDIGYDLSDQQEFQSYWDRAGGQTGSVSVEEFRSALNEE